MAYATTTLYSGLAIGTPHAASFASALNGLTELPQPDKSVDYDPTLVALAAEHLILDSLFADGLPTTRSSLATLVDSLRSARLLIGVSSSVRDSSEGLGRRLGAVMVAWATSDGFAQTRGKPFSRRIGAAYWVPDAPATVYATQNISGISQTVTLNNPANVAQAGSQSDRDLILNRPKSAANKNLPAVNMAGEAEPYWGTLRPFALKRFDECAVADPPSYSTDRSSQLYQEAEQVRAMMLTTPPLRLAVKADTEEQTRREREAAEKRAIALYWADNAGESGTPAGHWSSIASQVASQRHLTALEASRVLAVSAIAQADAFIATWGYKYKYSLIRPRTYIRRVIDSRWEPAIPTPPFPEYPSAHSAQSAAAAEVLSRLVGDSVPLVDSTGMALGNSPRQFTSFRAAAQEAGLSRIYGGIHFSYGNLGGRHLGECIGTIVLQRVGALGQPLR